MDYLEEKRLCESYRGRRLVACRAVDSLRRVIESLPDGPYSQLSGGVGKEAMVTDLPGSTKGRKRDMENLTKVLLGMILNDNDGPERMSSEHE